MKKITAILLAALLALMSLTALAEAAEVGKPAPDFELQTLAGETFKLSEQAGKVVFLNLWATWCPPCVDEIPDIQKLSEAHPDDLVVIGASVDQNVDDVKAFVEENKLTYPIAMDEGFNLIMNLYPSQYIPMSVFITPDGVVTYMDATALPYETMEALYQEALGK